MNEKTKRIAKWLGGAGALVTGAWLLLPRARAPKVPLTPDERVTGIPLGRGVAFRKAKTRAEFFMSTHFGDFPNGVILVADGQPVSFAGSGLNAATVHQMDGSPVQPTRADAKAWSVLNEAWTARRRTLPKDASQGWDKYSKEAYYIPAWLMRPLGAPAAAVTAFPVDEFGRIKAGHYGDGGGLWGATIGGLMQNPLFRVVVTSAVVIGTGGTGVAVLAAYNMWQNRGRDLSLKNAALGAARAYAVSQCGEACGAAFDFGAGVASGRSVSESAEASLEKQLTPEQRAYFAQGKSIVKSAGEKL